MTRPDEPQEFDKKQYNLNLALAAVAGQVGLVTLIIILVSLFGGLALDKYLNTKPMFTILLMVGSVPVTVFLMFRIVRVATNQIKPSVKQKSQSPTEENNRE